MGGVLDQPQAVLVGEGLHGVHVEHQPADVNGQDAGHLQCRIERRAAGAEIGDLPFGVGQIYVKRHGVAIHKERHRPLVANHFGRGGKGHRRYQHRLTGA